MWQRLSRVVICFAAVVGCYVVYSLAAVPFIEPSIDTRSEQRASDADIQRARKSHERQLAELAAWFAPGDWELSTPKILQNAQGMLLLKDYRNRGDGKVEINPCTMILLPEGEFPSEEERRRRAVLIRCPEGAVLQFDAPFDLRQARIGKLIGGSLLGPITIHSQQRDPGPQDDLIIRTRDVALTEQRIHTPHPVQFQLGPHRGSGRRLAITMGQGRSATGLKPGSKMNVGALEMLELAEAVEARIQPGAGDMFPGAGPAQTEKSQGPAPPKPPVEIRCQGPFRFDFQRYAASFTEQVDVSRLNSPGPSDQLTCQVLNLYFESQPAGGAHKPGSQPRLTPSRLEAFGNPVIIRAPTNGVEAQGQQIEYDLKAGGATLRDGKEAWIRQGTREIHSREVYFQPDESKRLGTFLASGAGWLKGAMPDDAAQQFEASWSRRLHFRPVEKQHVLSIEGTAHVHSIGRGQMHGEELHVWLSEVPPIPQPDEAAPSRKIELAPDRMLAKGKVAIDAPQLSAAVAQLQMWFERPIGAPSAQPAMPANSPLGNLPPGAHLVRMPIVPAGAEDAAWKPSAVGEQQAEGGRQPSAQHFHVVGEQLKIRARNLGQVMEVAEVIVEYNVELTETQTKQPGEKPLVVRGDQVHLLQPSPNEATVTVNGKPGYVEARGLTLASASIHLDRGQNLLWTDGHGQMTLLVDRDLQGAAVAEPRPLVVDWQGAMRFDGVLARFDRDVVARQAAQLMRTDLLEVTLSQAVRFDSARPDASAAETRPQVQVVSCRQGVFMENRSFAGSQLVSIDRMQAVELTVDATTGDLRATGPGVVTTVRLPGSDDKAMLGGRFAAAQPRAAEAGQQRPGLAYRSIGFQRQLSGNMRRQELAFENQIRGVFGSVPDWEQRLDPDRPETWGEQGAGLTCDRLDIAELPGSTAEKRLFELTASGNTLVESTQYTARAARLTYTQAKDLLVLEGNGRTDARLFQQTSPGAAPSEAAARKIWFWPATNQVEVDDARFLDLNNLPQR